MHGPLLPFACACCAVFSSAPARVDVFLPHHQAVFERDSGRVAEPTGDDLDRVLFDQFRFPARPEIVKQARARGQAGPLDDLFKRRAQVGVHPSRRPHCRLAESLIYIILHGPLGRQIERPFQVPPQFRKQRKLMSTEPSSLSCIF
jgi:hypothetical protein